VTGLLQSYVHTCFGWLSPSFGAVLGSGPPRTPCPSFAFSCELWSVSEAGGARSGGSSPLGWFGGSNSPWANTRRAIQHWFPVVLITASCHKQCMASDSHGIQQLWGKEPSAHARVSPFNGWCAWLYEGRHAKNVIIIICKYFNMQIKSEIKDLMHTSWVFNVQVHALLSLQTCYGNPLAASCLGPMQQHHGNQSSKGTHAQQHTEGWADASPDDDLRGCTPRGWSGLTNGSGCLGTTPPWGLSGRTPPPVHKEGERCSSHCRSFQQA